MDIALLSDCRVPTLPYSGHGLGRMAIDLANGLRAAGHEVTLYAGEYSEWDGTLRFHHNERQRARMFAEQWPDAAHVIIDLSHDHLLSVLLPDANVVNWIADTEVSYSPPNALVGNEWQWRHFPRAKIVPLGIDVDSYTMQPRADTPYLAFVAKMEYRKGFDLAHEIAQKAGIPLIFAGSPEQPVITDHAEFCKFVGGAVALLSPCRHDAGGRVNLEAAACGTPVITTDWTGSQYHVKHCISGFVCKDIDEMADAVQDCARLDRAAMRDWVKGKHNLSHMVAGVVKACEKVIGGERW